METCSQLSINWDSLNFYLLCSSSDVEKEKWKICVVLVPITEGKITTSRNGQNCVNGSRIWEDEIRILIGILFKRLFLIFQNDVFSCKASI